MKTVLYVFFGFLLTYAWNSIACEQSADKNFYCVTMADSVDFSRFKDSVFIEINGDLGDVNVIMANKTTYDRAYYRICEYIKVKDGQLHWAVHKGSELRISENIFNHVIKG